jgi:hypothetical protein
MGSDSGLWGDVGAQLTDIRGRRGYATTGDAFKACQKPSQKTMEEIEAGRIKTLKTLDDYCEVLGTNTIDVIRQVLAPAAPLDADAVRVALAYQAKSDNPRVTALQPAMWEMALTVEERLRE